MAVFPEGSMVFYHFRSRRTGSTKESQAKYNDGHGFIRGRREHPFAHLYTWGVCREPCTKLGMNWEERILRLHWMVHAVVHIQQFINKRNFKYQPYGPWGHFPKWMYGTSDSSISDSDSNSNSN